MTKHKLIIKPAISIEHRHQIEHLLEKLGYSVSGSGQWVNNKECDITFETSLNPTKRCKCGEYNLVSATYCSECQKEF